MVVSSNGVTGIRVTRLLANHPFAHSALERLQLCEITFAATTPVDQNPIGVAALPHYFGRYGSPVSVSGHQATSRHSAIVFSWHIELNSWPASPCDSRHQASRTARIKESKSYIWGK